MPSKWSNMPFLGSISSELKVGINLKRYIPKYIAQKYGYYYIQSFISYSLAVYHGVISCSFEYLGEI